MCERTKVPPLGIRYKYTGNPPIVAPKNDQPGDYQVLKWGFFFRYEKWSQEGLYLREKKDGKCQAEIFRQARFSFS